MSSPARNPSILALNRFFKPSAFNTGPPIPKVLPVSLGPSPSSTPSDSARRRTATPDLTSSPASSISSLPSTSSHSRSSSRSSFAPTRSTPITAPLPLESDHIKQIFAQPLLVDLLAGTTDHESQIEDRELAEKMNVHLNLLNSASGATRFGHDLGGNQYQMSMYEVDGGYAYGYPGAEGEGYYQDAHAYGYQYAPNTELAYDPAYAHLYQHEAGTYHPNPHQPELYAGDHEQGFDVPQTARPEDYFGFPHADASSAAPPPPPPPPSAAFTVPAEFNANLNPNAVPFVPSTSSTLGASREGAPASASASASTPASSSYAQAATTTASKTPLYPPGLPILKSARKDGLGLGLDTLVERAHKRLSAGAEAEVRL